jgi:hypothetical protein
MGFTGVPTRGFLLAKLEFCDRRKSPEFFRHPPLHPKFGWGAPFSQRIVVVPTRLFLKFQILFGKGYA